MNLKYYKLIRTDDRFDEQEMIESPDGNYLKKEEVQPILDAYNNLIEKLQEYKSDVLENMEYRRKETEAYNKLAALPDNRLPLIINNLDKDSPEHFIISCRLSGEDPLTKDLSKCILLLYNVEFNTESYKNIGYNDGLAMLTSILLKIAGLEEDSKQAFNAMYSCD